MAPLFALLTSLVASSALPDRLQAIFDGTRAPRDARECDELVRLQPRQLKAWHCYQNLAWYGGAGALNTAVADLRAHLAHDPLNPYAQVTLGVILNNQGGDDSENLYRAAAEGFRAIGDAYSEARARIFLYATACDAGRCDEVEADMLRAEALAQQTKSDELSGFAHYFRGLRAYHDGDLAEAARLFQESRREEERARTQWLGHRTLDGLAAVHSALGLHRQAFDEYRAEVELLEGDIFFQPLARHGVAVEAVQLAEEGDLPQAEADRLIAEALEAEVKAGVRHYQSAGEFNTRVLLALRLGPTSEGIEQLEQALRLGVQDNHPELQIVAGRLLALLEVLRDPTQPERPLRLASDSIERARLTARRRDVGLGLLVRATARWKSGARAEAKRDACAAVDELDRLRQLQPEHRVRALVSSELALAYALVAGWLLDPAHGPREPEDLDLAFGISERLRARALFDALDSIGADATPLAPLRDRRKAILSSIARTQSRLLSPGLIGSDRQSALAELGRLEAQEAGVADELARASPSSLAARSAPPSIARVQRALGEDEALLSFLTWKRVRTADAPFQDGSSWVLAIARDRIRAARIPDADALAESVPQFNALLARRDGSEAQAAARLYRDLLREALDEMPQVKHLIIVPDGPLHTLPFEVLRAAPDQPPLAARYQVGVTPSAALWLRWRGATPPIARVPALVLADPQTSGAAIAQYRYAAPWQRGLSLGPLPYSRAEGRAVVDALGRGSKLLLGAEASERALKTTNLLDYGVIHFAAHAVVDEEQPERSAVILAPGGPEDDGLLQPRDVLGLDLSGRAVVLAACDSAAGPVLRGEGVLSLARAFFQAGAHAVVGSRWPLRDDEAAVLMASFYRGLGRGLSVGQAMSEAQRNRIGAGAPAAAWAGLVVLGDGGLVPLPQPTAGWPATWLALSALGVVLAGLGFRLLRNAA